MQQEQPRALSDLVLCRAAQQHMHIDAHLAGEDGPDTVLGVPHAGARLAIAGQARVANDVGAGLVLALVDFIEGLLVAAIVDAHVRAQALPHGACRLLTLQVV